MILTNKNASNVSKCFEVHFGVSAMDVDRYVILETFR